jgi:hypothetical protein
MVTMEAVLLHGLSVVRSGGAVVPVQGASGGRCLRRCC